MSDQTYWQGQPNEALHPYHHRILDWFGHDLKGEPAPSRITSGVTFLDKEKAAPKKSGSS